MREKTVGVAISFCDHDERTAPCDIERTIRRSVPVIEDHPYHFADIANRSDPAKQPPYRNKRPGRPRRNHQRSRRTRGQGGVATLAANTPYLGAFLAMRKCGGAGGCTSDLQIMSLEHRKTWLVEMERF